MNYYSLKVPELKKLCKEKKIRGYSKLRKKELIELLNNSNQKKCHSCNKHINGNNFIKYNENKFEHLECYNKNNNIILEHKNCSICLDIIDKKDEFKTECNHYFHKDCINRWDESNFSGNKCPNCRQQIKKPITYREIHNEIVRTSDNIEINNLFNNVINEDFNNLFFQMIYILIIYKKILYNNDIQKVIDSVHMDINMYINQLFETNHI